MELRLFDTTVGDLVKERPALARVLDTLGIDTCCGGGATLGEACRSRGLDPARVASLLAGEEGLDAPAQEADPASMELPALCDRIEAVHHRALRTGLPRLQALADKVARVHGRTDRRLVELAEALREFAAELEEHMQKEERILFPGIRALAGSPDAPAFHCGTLLHPILKMASEHEDASLQLMRMSLLADGFEAPGWACSSYRQLLDGLLRLTGDLRVHIDEEERVLFPRARILEQERLAAFEDPMDLLR